MIRGWNAMQRHHVATFCFGMAAGALNHGAYGRVAEYLHVSEGLEAWHREGEDL